MFVQHDAIVPDLVFIAKGECIVVYVLFDTNKCQHLIGPNTPCALSKTSTEELHKHTVMLKMKSTWVMVGSKQTIDLFEQIVRLKETIRNSNAIKELVQTTQRLPYRIQSMRCTMASPLYSYENSLSMRNFKLKNLVRTRKRMKANTNRIHPTHLRCRYSPAPRDTKSIGTAP
jgi:hypothetical protein